LCNRCEEIKHEKFYRQKIVVYSSKSLALPVFQAGHAETLIQQGFEPYGVKTLRFFSQYISFKTLARCGFRPFEIIFKMNENYFVANKNRLNLLHSNFLNNQL